MDAKIRYLNTDLDLRSAEDLRSLAAELGARGLLILDVFAEEDGRWHARFEAASDHKEPEDHIAQMLDAIASLSAPALALWQRCELREFNIGCDCGTEPWAFNLGLSPPLLGRLAVHAAALRLTLYPQRGP